MYVRESHPDQVSQNSMGNMEKVNWLEKVSKWSFTSLIGKQVPGSKAYNRPPREEKSISERAHEGTAISQWATFLGWHSPPKTSVEIRACWMCWLLFLPQRLRFDTSSSLSTISMIPSPPDVGRLLLVWDDGTWLMILLGAAWARRRFVPLTSASLVVAVVSGMCICNMLFLPDRPSPNFSKDRPPLFNSRPI